MIITEIKKMGKNKHKLFNGESLVGIFADEALVRYPIKTGCEVDEKFFAQLKEESDKILAFDAALYFLSGIKSEKQVRDRLYQKGYSKKIVDFCIEKLKKYNYLNDKQFAEFYVKTYKETKGKRLLEFELKAKGIKKEIIDEVINDDFNSIESIEKICEKYFKNKEKTQKNVKNLINRLLSKGFSFNDVLKSTKKYLTNFEGDGNESWS